MNAIQTLQPYSAAQILSAFPPSQESKTGSTRYERQKQIETSDNVLSALSERDMVHGRTSEGGYNIVCPFEDEHTTGTNGTDTQYYPAHTGGYATAKFNCLHSHCQGRPMEAWRARLDLPAGEAADKHTSQTIGITEMLRTAREPLPWVIKDYLIENTLTVIYGPPKSYKTFVALDMALAQATGQPFLGIYDVLQTGLVIYVAGEGQSGLAQRALAWCMDRGIPEIDDETVLFRRTRGAVQINSGGAALIAAECERIAKLTGQPIMGIYIDTLQRNFGDGDENSTADMTAFVRAVDTHLRERFGCAVVIVHHSGHGDQNRARGSIVLAASADAQFRVTANHPLVMLGCDFMKDAEIPPARSLLIEKIPLGFDDQFGQPVKSVVLHITDEQPEPLQLSEEEKLGLSLLSNDWLAYPIWRDDFIYAAAKVPAQKGKNAGKIRCNSTLRGAVSRCLVSLEKKNLVEVDRCNTVNSAKLRLARVSEVLQQ